MLPVEKDARTMPTSTAFETVFCMADAKSTDRILQQQIHLAARLPLGDQVAWHVAMGHVHMARWRREPPEPGLDEKGYWRHRLALLAHPSPWYGGGFPDGVSCESD